MNDFAGMEDLLSDFLLEAGEMLSEVDSRLQDLEKSPEDSKLLNEIFRGFHTIKGGAGFLNATELVSLCHITENVFDKLRNRELSLSNELMVVVSAATAEVRTMFGALQQNLQPSEAPGELIDALKAVLSGQKRAIPASLSFSMKGRPGDVESAGQGAADWDKLYKSLTDTEIVAKTGPEDHKKIIAAAVPEADSAEALPENRVSETSGIALGLSADDESAKEAVKSTMRVDTDRLDKLLNISGEIGLTKSRLTHLRTDIIQGRIDADTMHELDQAISQLEILVMNLQNAVIKTRMQPIGRLFKKYPPQLNSLARSLGKDVELVLVGEDTEMDTSLIEELDEPLLNLLRYTVDQGIETVEERIAAGKANKSIVELSAQPEGDHILISIADDGRGMRPEVIRKKAVEKGLISMEVAYALEDNQCLELIFLPGFGVKDENHGSGAAMYQMKAGIQDIDGVINIQSEYGKGTVINILLPLTQAILPVLILRLGEQSFAVPLSLVKETVSVSPEKMQLVSGRPSMVVHGKVLPVLPLAQLIGWEQSGTPNKGVLVQSGNDNFILSVDSFVGQDNVVIKPFDAFRPKGVAAVTVSGEGDIVLILDIKELIGEIRAR
jgi:two-component system chemotaxis sensor kinase CheA